MMSYLLRISLIVLLSFVFACSDEPYYDECRSDPDCSASYNGPYCLDSGICAESKYAITFEDLDDVELIQECVIDDDCPEEMICNVKTQTCVMEEN